MGATQSYTGSLEDAFPIPKELDRDLDKLSWLAARILSTPDIYDVNNLSNPGVCGEYAVFLKKKIEKSLQPFMAKIKENGTDKLVEVRYQNPRYGFGTSKEDQDNRKAVCAQMTDALLRVIATVVALLASMQVANVSRETAASSVPIQTGGGISDVRTWLVSNRIVLSSGSNPNQFTFVAHGEVGQPRVDFILNLVDTYGSVTRGTITAHPRGVTTEEAYPSGELKIEFLDAISVSSTTTVMPMRIVDSTGQAWFAGILMGDKIKSFYQTTPETYLFRVINGLFRKTQGWTVELHESRVATASANEIWQQTKRAGTSQAMFSAIGAWLQTRVPGAGALPYPGAAAVYPGAGAAAVYPGAGAAAVYPGAGAAAGYYPGAGFVPPAPAGYYPGASVAYPSITAARPTIDSAYFQIPSKSSRDSIIKTFKDWRNILPKQSNPAVVRALTLRGTLTDRRNVITNVCNDPYWSEKGTLDKIYPWATFQFLSIKDWGTANDPTRKMDFYLEWKDFVESMSGKSTEGGAAIKYVKFVRNVADTYDLRHIRFSPKEEGIPVCKSGKIEVRPERVQTGIARLQKLYSDHVKSCWKILTELVFIIADPATKTEQVQLHPATTSVDSLDYVNRHAEQARRLLRSFYLNVEYEYQEAAANLVSV